MEVAKFIKVWHHPVAQFNAIQYFKFTSTLIYINTLKLSFLTYLVGYYLKNPFHLKEVIEIKLSTGQ